MTLQELTDKIRDAGVEPDELARELAVSMLIYNEANPGDENNDMRVSADIWQRMVELAKKVAEEG